MVLDRVPIDIRWQIYLNVRLFGWTAFNSKAAAPTDGATSAELL